MHYLWTWNIYFCGKQSSISLYDHIKTTKYKQAIRGETSSFEVTDYFVNLLLTKPVLFLGNKNMVGQAYTQNLKKAFK